jgi:hypothetical protein
MSDRSFSLSLAISSFAGTSGEPQPAEHTSAYDVILVISDATDEGMTFRYCHSALANPGRFDAPGEGGVSTLFHDFGRSC